MGHKDQEVKRRHRDVVKEALEDATVDLLLELSDMAIELREERDELFYSLMDDMFGSEVTLEIGPMEQRFRKFEMEHVALVLSLVLHPSNRSTYIMGLSDLCSDYESEIRLLKAAKSGFIRPYTIGVQHNLTGPKRQFDTIQDLLDSVKQRSREPVHEDILHAVNENNYKGGLRNGILILSCLANKYRTEFRNLFAICQAYFESEDDLSPDEVGRLEIYGRAIENSKSPDERVAEEIWQNGVSNYSDKLLTNLAEVCNKYKANITELSQMYAMKRKVRDDAHLQELRGKKDR